MANQETPKGDVIIGAVQVETAKDISRELDTAVNAILRDLSSLSGPPSTKWPQEPA